MGLQIKGYRNLKKLTPIMGCYFLLYSSLCFFGQTLNRFSKILIIVRIYKLSRNRALLQKLKKTKFMSLIGLMALLQKIAVVKIYDCVDASSDKDYSIKELNLALVKTTNFITNTKKIQTSIHQKEIQNHNLTNDF